MMGYVSSLRLCFSCAGSNSQPKVRLQSKLPRLWALPFCAGLENRNVLRSMVTMSGLTTTVLSSAIRAKRGSSQPWKHSPADPDQKVEVRGPDEPSTLRGGPGRGGHIESLKPLPPPPERWMWLWKGHGRFWGSKLVSINQTQTTTDPERLSILQGMRMSMPSSYCGAALPQALGSSFFLVSPPESFATQSPLTPTHYTEH